MKRLSAADFLCIKGAGASKLWVTNASECLLFFCCFNGVEDAIHLSIGVNFTLEWRFADLPVPAKSFSERFLIERGKYTLNYSHNKVYLLIRAEGVGSKKKAGPVPLLWGGGHRT